MTPRQVTIPFPSHPKYGQAEITAVTRLMRSGHLSEVHRGPAVAALEDAFAVMTGTSRALSFESGTASLHAALHAAGAAPGQGVTMSPMTWISAITAAFQAGSFPVFARPGVWAVGLLAADALAVPGTSRGVGAY